MTIRVVFTNNRSNENNCDQRKRTLGRSTVDARHPWDGRSGAELAPEWKTSELGDGLPVPRGDKEV
jgi:hypothetical protein